jgi:hypothetical protein
MKNFECPNCHQHTISFWRRQIVGPTSPVTCSNCGAEIGITWANYFWPLIPFVIAWGLSELVESRALYWGLNLAGLAVWLWLSNQFVPLIVKTKSSDQRVQP